MNDPAVVEALNRIQMEFAEMPGLKLTASQVNRLCNIPHDVCQSALNALLQKGYLKLSGEAFLRYPGAKPRRAVVA